MSTPKRFYGKGLPGVDPSLLTGTLIVLEGIDGSGRSTQIALLKEWLESQCFAVETIGLRRSNLMKKNIDDLVARNDVTPVTLALMYATDFFDQLENVMIPALRAGVVVLADRYIYTLIARAAVRGLTRKYLEWIYQIALKPDLTFWLDVSPNLAFERVFKKSQAISFWESGRDLSLSDDLFESFIRYQTMVRRQLVSQSKKHPFITYSNDGSVAELNAKLRRRIASYLGIKKIAYRPSASLSHLLR